MYVYVYTYLWQYWLSLLCSWVIIAWLISFFFHPFGSSALCVIYIWVSLPFLDHVNISIINSIYHLRYHDIQNINLTMYPKESQLITSFLSLDCIKCCVNQMVLLSRSCTNSSIRSSLVIMGVFSSVSCAIPFYFLYLATITDLKFPNIENTQEKVNAKSHTKNVIFFNVSICKIWKTQCNYIYKLSQHQKH